MDVGFGVLVDEDTVLDFGVEVGFEVGVGDGVGEGVGVGVGVGDETGVEVLFVVPFDGVGKIVQLPFPSLLRPADCPCPGTETSLPESPYPT